MTFVRIAIWIATAFFVTMLFTPLVRQMLARLFAEPGGLP